MKIGIIAEGISDVIVLKAILKAKLGLEESAYHYIRPELFTDETDLSVENKKFSNWELVKNECTTGNSIQKFLENPTQGTCAVIIQIDSAECDLANYGVHRPSKSSANYVSDCYYEITQKIFSWLQSNPSLQEILYENSVVCAVSVEEIEAWLIAYHDQNNLKKDSGFITNPKEKLTSLTYKNFSPREQNRLKDEVSKAEQLSKNLRKKKELTEAMKHNASLELFVKSLCWTIEDLLPGQYKFF